MPAVFVLISIVVLFFVVRKLKREKMIKELKNSAGYEVALEINTELSKKDYKVGWIWFGSKISLMTSEHVLWGRNFREITKNRYYAIENANIGLLVESFEASKTIPLFIEIAAEVIKNSEYSFEHPECLYEHPKTKEYLNVMFQ